MGENQEFSFGHVKCGLPEKPSEWQCRVGSMSGIQRNNLGRTYELESHQLINGMSGLGNKCRGEEKKVLRGLRNSNI